ncbi:ATP synthase E chain-like protein [Elsinoe australis]|uniref:ATP synthase F(0) complex subunit e, mitochondrial n=1 Tax=Elsinoe australis TaxID=40998 RepID=A0A2P7Z1Z5_9PEZI|nr:hypothetical protein B9Z65_4153 [Elsinoe australis]TKX22394.1 ATP synthase E chain-like protein [Elsinoe australis]
MASTGVNVLRWSALGLGVFYGAYHQSTIRSADRTAAAKQEYERKEKLITQAKAEFAKRNMPKDKLTAGGGLISDPEDPKFDLEAFLKAKAAES